MMQISQGKKNGILKRPIHYNVAKGDSQQMCLQRDRLIDSV